MAENVTIIGQSDTTFDGSEENDTYTVIFGDNNTINGAGGGDLINGANGVHTVMNGDAGNDRLVGNQDDELHGGANNDEISLTLQSLSQDITGDLETIHNGIGVTLGGAVISDVERGFIALGTGNDTVTASSSATIFLYGYDGGDHLIGDVGFDTMAGGNGRDVLDGLGGDDLLFAFSPVNFNPWNGSASIGADDDASIKNYLNGGDGNDTLRASGGQDFFDGGDGIDTISYDPDTEIAPGVKIDLKQMLQDNVSSALDRVSSIENVDGSGGDDTLRGDEGANSLFGGVGNDFLSAGGGADTVRGGDGSDVFSYKSLEAIDGDRVIDLDAPDFLDLRGIDADTTKGGNQKFKAVDEFHGKAGELLLVIDSPNAQTIASMDVDGDGVADATFFLNGSHASDNVDNFVL
jgi:Ca2+-binding RTX toxin-like protein